MFEKVIEVRFGRQTSQPKSLNAIRPSPEAYEELGISPNLIYRWRSELKAYGSGSFPGNGRPKMTTQESELAKLQRELRDVKMERDILKKAITIFSSSDRKGSHS
jgi:transposase